jgi:hypothetical protein
MVLKYAGIKHVTSAFTKLHYSNTLTRISKVMSQAENHIEWILGEGKINFWYDTWIKGLKLHRLVICPIPNPMLTVKEVLNHLDHWLGSVNISNNTIHIILSLQVHISDSKDRRIWNNTSHDNFTSKSAWQMLHSGGVKLDFDPLI